MFHSCQKDGRRQDREKQRPGRCRWEPLEREPGVSLVGPYTARTRSPFETAGRIDLSRSPLERAQHIGSSFLRGISRMAAPLTGPLAGSSSKLLGWRFMAAFLCLCILNLLVTLEATSLSVALPVITQSLHGSSSQGFWCGAAFLLGETVVQPLWASFSHTLGRKPMILLALGIYTVGTILCSVSINMSLMICGRCIQGIGSGGLLALSYVLVTDLVALRDRAKWFGFMTMMWAMGSVTGPVIGGTFSEKTTWRWIFGFNLPLCGVAFVVIPIFMKLRCRPGPLGFKLSQIDWIGSFIFVALMTTVLVPLIWAGVMYPWHHWKTVSHLVLLGLLGIVGFVLYSKQSLRDPLIRGSVFKSRTALINFFGTILHGTIMFSLIHHLPLYHRISQSMGSTTTGMAALSQTWTIAPAAMVVGLIIARTGHYRWAIWLGWATTTIGLGLLVLLLHEEAPAAGWIGLNLISGLGLGILLPAIGCALQASAAATDGDFPLAAALFSFFHSMGKIVGVGLGGVVFQTSFQRSLSSSSSLSSQDNTLLLSSFKSKSPFDASLIADLIHTLSPAAAHVVRTASINALTVFWLLMCGLATLATLVSFTTPHLPFDNHSSIILPQQQHHDHYDTDHHHGLPYDDVENPPPRHPNWVFDPTRADLIMKGLALPVVRAGGKKEEEEEEEERGGVNWLNKSWEGQREEGWGQGGELHNG